MDFLTYNGNPGDTVVPSKNWSYIGKNTWDGHQMFFATPLTKLQMKKTRVRYDADDRREGAEQYSSWVLVGTELSEPVQPDHHDQVLRPDFGQCSLARV